MVILWVSYGYPMVRSRTALVLGPFCVCFWLVSVCIRFGLDFAANEEVVDGESDPAESKHENAGDDFAEQSAFGSFEDVHNAPNGANNTQDVNNGTNHTCDSLKSYIKKSFTSLNSYIKRGSMSLKSYIKRGSMNLNSYIKRGSKSPG